MYIGPYFFASDLLTGGDHPHPDIQTYRRALEQIGVLENESQLASGEPSVVA